MDLVGDALERPPAVRAAWLAEQCGPDRKLLDDVNALLREATSATALTAHLRKPVLRAAGALVDEHASRTGERVGAYRLTGVLGHGGMGTVYLAERDDGEYRARVAIKFVSGLLATPELERRFRAERQILADLNHPNIARLFDGGAAADGTPYLVMEYVEGQPIDVWCDAQALGVRARVELFLRVCAAVAHAHRSGVVHRDLKPPNILVTAEGVPKLVDFGIARQLGEGAEAAQATAVRVLTPGYASPEQVRGDPVSSASDVYSLGVVLYELLSGRPPFELERAPILEIERQICHVQPVAPSRAAAGRGAQWRRELDGQLDRIVLRALKKQPELRHPSVGALAGELHDFLVTPPPGPVALPNRSGGLARRWTALAAASAILLLGGAAPFLLRSRRAAQSPPPVAFELLPSQESPTAFPQPARVHAADLNGDGRADLLWNHLGAGTNRTRVALARADGTFAYQDDFEYPHPAAGSWDAGYELVVGDYSGDGRADLAWYRPESPQKVIYLAFSGDAGSFHAPAPYELAEMFWHTWRMYAADANGDGRDDVLLNHLGVENVARVFRSKGDGTFELGPNVLHHAQFWSRYSTHVADSDGNGRPDIIWNDVPGGINRTYVARSLDTLRALPWQDHPLTVVEDLPPERSRWTGFTTHVADVDGDRIADIIWVAPDRDPMVIHRALGRPTGQFRYLVPQEVLRPARAGTVVSLTGDFNGDGRTDLLLDEATAQGGRMWIALGTRDGSFALERAARERPAGAAATGILVPDVNGDRRSDIVWYERSPTCRIRVALAR